LFMLELYYAAVVFLWVWKIVVALVSFLIAVFVPVCNL
jgi:hypothetical protein